MKIKVIGVDIPIKKITISPYHFRKETGDERLEELAKSMQKFGQIHAVSVIRKNGANELINGHRRFKAAKLAGMETLRANTYEFEDHEKDEATRRQVIAQFLLAANKQEPLVPIERARFWQWLIEELSMTQEDVAEVHNTSVDDINSDLMFLNLDTAVLDLVAAAPDRFSQQHLRVLATYASPGKKAWRITPAEQKKLAQKLLTQEDKAASASAGLSCSNRAQPRRAPEGADRSSTRRRSQTTNGVEAKSGSRSRLVSRWNRSSPRSEPQSSSVKS